jgi:hypothetical protein
MTDRPSLFRQEALDSWASGRDAAGDVLRLGSRWVRWSYWLLLALALAGGIAGWATRTDASVTGPAVVNGQDRSFAALLPAVPGQELQGARSVRVELHGLPDRSGLPATLLPAERADEALVVRAGLRPSAQPAILVTGLIDRRPGTPMPAATGLDGQATVVVRRERVLQLLLRQLEGMVGRPEARS